MSNEMIPDDVMEMLPEFLQESEEHLQVLNEKMLDAENAIKSGAQMDAKELNTMFRSAHTIKGTASFIGLKKTVALTHKAETLLQKLRDGEMRLSAPIVDVLFAAFDKLNSLFATLKENKSEGVEIDQEVQRIEGLLNPQGSAIQQPVIPPPSPLPKEEEPEIETVKSYKEEEGVNEKYLEQFVSEAEQNVDDLNNLLVKAEESLQDAQIVNEIFRIMHTIKGSSGIVNIKPIAEVAHKMENILQFFRSQNRGLPSDMTSVLFKGADAIKAMVDSLKKTRKVVYDSAEICKVLDKSSIKIVLEMKMANPTKLPQKKEEVIEATFNWKILSKEQASLIKTEFMQDSDVYIIEGIIASRETMKSMRCTMIEERLKKNGKVVSVLPSPTELDAIKTDAMIGILFCTNINESNIREILAMDGLTIKTVEKADQDFIQIITGDKLMEKNSNPEIPVTEQPNAAAPVAVKEENADSSKGGATPIEISTVKIDARKLDKLMNLSGELVIIRSQFARLVGLFNNDIIRQKDSVRSLDRTAALMAELEKETNSSLQTDSIKLQKSVAELKENFFKLSSLMTEESVIHNIQMLSETTGSLEKTASDLQASVMQTRMVPVEGVFTRFKRIVRDIAKDLDKEVVLQIEGSETELDKKIVDGLGDPLTHMIRNAVDHGLEDRETRLKLGKPAVGSILLKASHKGNSICIEIRDDGKGMDPAKIAEIAVKKGVITQEQSAKMTDKEKLNLIFLPGFSTAQKVTGLSGRGVGMDVVKSMITSFNGVVDINTQVGVGSTFVLKIPLTLAIIQALLVIIGGDVYALPIDAVREIIKVPAKDIYFIDGNETVKLRNHALSLVELEKVIHIKANTVLENEDRRVVIITDGESRLGVLVDSLVGKDEIVIKSFSKHFSRVKGIIGASILADGSVALILDPGTIIKESR